MTTLGTAHTQFILHWGEMGTRWGINRTVAQIQALLFLSPEPLHAEQIAETLGVARSNVSTSIKELLNWGIIKVSHKLGDRRDYFSCLEDPWDMFRIILEERRKREIDPTIAALKECVALSKTEAGKDHFTTRRLAATLEFFEVTTQWYLQVQKLPTRAVIKFMKLGSKIQAFLKRQDA